jgi:leucyl/phenylalanyl-tRNA---protein transferase
MNPRRLRSPFLLSPDAPTSFPDPKDADDDGLLAIGGDLSVERLLAAYDEGIFPWYNEGLPVLWWSPNPRGVLFPEKIHISRSMRRVIQRAGFELSWNRCFNRVIHECGAHRSEGTWLVPEMVRAYRLLHRRGLAHSLEVWCDGELVGGIYGVQRGGLFAAESMFHRSTNASKLALIALAQSLGQAGIRLIDVQFVTAHLRSLGAEEVLRPQYLDSVRQLRNHPIRLRELVPRIGI